MDDIILKDGRRLSLALYHGQYIYMYIYDL
jgi:hypothetical protein